MGASSYAVVVDGQVVNVVLWDGVTAWQPAAGEAVVIPDESGVSIGWSYEDGEFVAPPEPEPVEED